MAQAVERLQELHEAGIGTIVDLTVVGLGRDIELVQKVAEQVDLHIVVATGLYTYNDLPTTSTTARRLPARAGWTSSTSTSSTISKMVLPGPACVRAS